MEFPRLHGLVLTAGGAGLRMGSDRPKQLLQIAGSSILKHALNTVSRARVFRVVVVTVPAAHRLEILDDLQSTSFDFDLRVIEGGRTRQESVARGLAALPGTLAWIWVHDAVRPFVPRGVWARLREGLEAGELALVPGNVPSDTMKRVDGSELITETVPRELLRNVQTPQAFEASLLLRAHDRAHEAGRVGTDEASLVEALGTKVRVVTGDPRSMKITTPFDLICAEAIYRTYGDGEENPA